MKVSDSNGTTYIGPYDPQKLAEEAAKPEFVSAKVYEPGKIVHMSDRDYRTGTAGNLIRIRHEEVL